MLRVRLATRPHFFPPRARARHFLFKSRRGVVPRRQTWVGWELITWRLCGDCSEANFFLCSWWLMPPVREVTGDKAPDAPSAPGEDNAERPLSRARRRGGSVEYWRWGVCGGGGDLHAYGHNKILSAIKRHNQLPPPCRPPRGRRRQEGTIRHRKSLRMFSSWWKHKRKPEIAKFLSLPS